MNSMRIPTLKTPSVEVMEKFPSYLPLHAPRCSSRTKNTIQSVTTQIKRSRTEHTSASPQSPHCGQFQQRSWKMNSMRMAMATVKFKIAPWFQQRSWRMCYPLWMRYCDLLSAAIMEDELDEHGKITSL